MRTRKQIMLTAAMITGATLASLFFVSLVYAEYYSGRVYPGVRLGQYELGGLTKEQVVELVEKFNNHLASEGIALAVVDGDGNRQTINIPTVVSGDSARELIALDSTAIASQAVQFGRSTSVSNPLTPWYIRFINPPRFVGTVFFDASNLKEVLQDNLKKFEGRPHNARLVLMSATSTEYTVLPEARGLVINYDDVLRSVHDSTANVLRVPLHVQLEQFNPTITASEIVPFLPRAEEIALAQTFRIEFRDPVLHATTSHVVDPSLWRNWLEVKRAVDGSLSIGLEQEKVIAYLENSLQPHINQAPENARFVIENDKVKEFQPSQQGMSLNTLKTYQALNTLVSSFPTATSTPVMAIVETVAPEVSVADVNALGITDVIGVGVSTFKDSHTNRIKNIAHAVERLNGYLIKPGEEFSANKAAGPFTRENGYLPEMVIKGKEIKPEVGGGMCQIGTTLFRMAMNSGMDITQRRNHSLVVSYYADPVNGNPGTDATLYEPMLDLKFKNDTGNYLLLQTAIDFKKQQLTFILWGKPDGRTGSYTHPIVHRWIGAGEPEDIIVDDGKLKPGEKRCQNAFRGAVASFNYTRITPTGEKIDRVFESYYRPLPRICMVGAEKSQECPEGQVCEPPAEGVAPVAIDTTVPIEIAN